MGDGLFVELRERDMKTVGIILGCLIALMLCICCVCTLVFAWVTLYPAFETGLPPTAWSQGETPSPTPRVIRPTPTANLVPADNTPNPDDATAAPTPSQEEATATL